MCRNIGRLEVVVYAASEIFRGFYDIGAGHTLRLRIKSVLLPLATTPGLRLLRSGYARGRLHRLRRHGGAGKRREP